MFERSEPLWDTRPPFETSYDAVLIGGGLHSLATAYYLARDHGMTDVAVLEKRYVGFFSRLRTINPDSSFSVIG